MSTVWRKGRGFWALNTSLPIWETSNSPAWRRVARRSATTPVGYMSGISAAGEVDQLGSEGDMRRMDGGSSRGQSSLGCPQ